MTDDSLPCFSTTSPIALSSLVTKTARRSRLLETIAQAARCGVDYIQLREKDLSTHELETLAREAVQLLRTENQKLKTVFLINSRTDIALACGAQGVHLRSNDISPSEVRKIWTQMWHGTRARVTVGVSCHTRAEVARAAAGRRGLRRLRTSL